MIGVSGQLPERRSEATKTLLQVTRAKAGVPLEYRREETSMGVDARGEMVGSTSSPTADVTSGDRALSYSLENIH